MTPEEPRTRRVEFLERGSYRQRRYRDAARLAPVFAALFMALPLLWPRAQPHQSLTSNGMIYLFTVWVGLVGLALVLSWLLQFGGAVSGEDAHAAPPKAGRDDRPDAESERQNAGHHAGHGE